MKFLRFFGLYTIPPTEHRQMDIVDHAETRAFLQSELASMPPLGDYRTQTLLRQISAELTRARTKFPGKNVTFAALIEEVGELSTSLFEEPRARVRAEAVQVAVMAMRVVLDGDHTFDQWRRDKGLDALVVPELNDNEIRLLRGCHAEEIPVGSWVAECREDLIRRGLITPEMEITQEGLEAMQQ